MIGHKSDNQVTNASGVQQAGRDIHGIPPEQHERMLQTALDALRADLEAKYKEANRADAAEHQMLQMRIDEYKRRLADPQAAYDDYIKTIAELRTLLEESAVDFGENRLNDAEAAMAADDYSKADKIFAEVQEHDARAVKRSAKAAYGQGLIAEQQVRWADAADHYSRAARLDPGYDTLIKAGEFLWRAGDYADAIRHNEQVMEISKTEFGVEHEKTAMVINNLAGCYWTTGRYGEAEPLFREVLAIDSKASGNANPECAIHLNNLANLLRDTDRYDEAELLYREALAIDRKTLDEAHPDYAIHLNNFAGLLRARRRYDEAEPLYREALGIDRKKQDGAHPDHAIRLNNLAELLKATERYDEAEPLYRKALAITCKTLGKAHRSYAIRLNNLAGLLQATGRYGEAEPLYREALVVFEAALGAEHPNTQTVRENLELFLANRPD